MMANREPSPVMVEFHGFQDNTNRFIIKEFAMVSERFQCHFVFDPPYGFDVLNFKMKKTACWLTRRYHLINWEERGLPYDESLIKVLCKPFPLIYTNGLEKTKFLSEFHSNVHDIAQYRAIAPSESYTVVDQMCTLNCHKDNLAAKCALRSALHHHGFLIKGYSEINCSSF